MDQPIVISVLVAGAILAALMAALIVKSMPIEYVRWLVIGVVTYTSANMLWTARTDPDAEPDTVIMKNNA